VNQVSYLYKTSQALCSKTMSQHNICIPEHHPVVKGHFPGHPVVPGALLLSYVSDLINTEYLGRLQINKLSHVKFLIPIVPAQLAVIHLTRTDSNKVVFQIRIEGNIYVKGEISTTEVVQ